ncbi:hypothetical protein CesoFtcFv8_001957 [Champsocephalus esox]|uniref:Uncharacterized protein n=1 Tax=Champsocephalus esox TaxID=159716 RepID=A0AAN8CWZ3_9TELE|nr:hypothetical protein CesoFtcFv8_001957 [Champsocephalus esox]
MPALGGEVAVALVRRDGATLSRLGGAERKQPAHESALIFPPPDPPTLWRPHSLEMTTLTQNTGPSTKRAFHGHQCTVRPIQAL